MATKHTPGPWRWWDENSRYPRPKNYDLEKIIGADGTIVYDSYGDGRLTPNKRLMLHAPEMLEVCELVRALMNPVFYDAPPQVQERWAECVTKAMAVIAKIEGRASNDHT